MQLISARATYCRSLTSARHGEGGCGTAGVTGFRPGKPRPGSADGTACSPASRESGTGNTGPGLPGEAARFTAGLPRRPGDPDPGWCGLRPDLAGPGYDDAAFAEALTGGGEAGDGPCDADEE